MRIGYDNDKNFAISAAKAKRWERMTDANDHARVTYEQISHMARGVQKTCGSGSRLYMEIATLAVKAKAILDYRDEHDGFEGGDEMWYLGLAYYKMACDIVEVIASSDAVDRYNQCA